MITCEKCGGLGYIDHDYKDGIRITGCDSCGYEHTETSPDLIYANHNITKVNNGEENTSI